VAVANARERVKAEAHYVTPHSGGQGAGRDAIEFILEAKGVLESVLRLRLTRAIAAGIDGYWEGRGFEVARPVGAR